MIEDELKKKKILDFLKIRKLAVIATTNPLGLPESALAAFAETEKLEIIFASFKDKRKNKNISFNNVEMKENIYFKVKPTWIRYTDINKKL